MPLAYHYLDMGGHGGGSDDLLYNDALLPMRLLNRQNGQGRDGCVFPNWASGLPCIVPTKQKLCRVPGMAERVGEAKQPGPLPDAIEVHFLDDSDMTLSIAHVASRGLWRWQGNKQPRKPSQDKRDKLQALESWIRKYGQECTIETREHLQDILSMEQRDLERGASESSHTTAA